MSEPASTSSVIAAQISTRFDQERVAELFGLAGSAYVVTPLNAGILAFFLWGPTSGEVIVAWLLSLVGVTAGRVLLHLAYQRSGTRNSDALAWERRFALGTLAAGAVWALLPALFFESGDPLQRIAIMFVVGGMIIGSAGIYSPSWRAFGAFVTLPVQIGRAHV